MSRAGFKVVRELWIAASAAATKYLKIKSSGDPAGTETSWVLPSALPTTGQILDATVSGTTVTLNWVNKPSGGAGSPVVTSLSSIAGSQQTFKGTSGGNFSTIELYDLLAVTAPTAPQLTTLGANALGLETATDTINFLVHPRLQAIAAQANPSETQIPQLSTAGVLSFANRSTFALATGTTSVTFSLESGSNPVLLKKTAIDTISIRNGADNADGNLVVKDLTAQNLTVTGTTTTINSTQLAIGDNIITLNADVPGATAPTENAGIEINRGSSGTLQLIYWDETTDEVFITQGGSVKRVAVDETITFTSTTNTATINYTSDVVTWNHNKNRRFFKYTMIDPNGLQVDVQANYVSANQTTWDLTGFVPLATGTWTIVA